MFAQTAYQQDLINKILADVYDYGLFNERPTLRDQFAMAALPGILSALMARYIEKGYSEDCAMHEAVRLSCIIADVMLEARKQNSNQKENVK